MKDITILRCLIDGSPEREIYYKGRKDVLEQKDKDMDSLILWVQNKILNFREINRNYKNIYSEDYIRAYEEVLSKSLSKSSNL